METQPETAQSILRKHGVEIDAGDHRPAEEIVTFLGLNALKSSMDTPWRPRTISTQKTNARAALSPYFVH